RLYRAEHETFEEYCKERWDFGRAYASRLIGAAETVKTLLPIGNTLPATESQARPLLQFDPADRPAVWEDVVKQAPIADDDRRIITARHVEATIRYGLLRSKDKPYKNRNSAIRKEQKAKRAPRRSAPFPGGVVYCPSCGGDDFFPNGQCRSCIPEDPESRQGKTRIGVQRAHEAIACLKKIPQNDALHKRAGEIVADWIRYNVDGGEPDELTPDCDQEPTDAPIEFVQSLQCLGRELRVERMSFANFMREPISPNDRPRTLLTRLMDTATEILTWVDEEIDRRPDEWEKYQEKLQREEAAS
ncbi:MAG TPA: hypothetical protein VE890_13025, partial [Thermoguttaceae bacterium]|nr:hypothetical protein [Thermoguttaceae bacterium]